MFVTTADEARRIADAGRGTQVPFVVRHWACVLGLASADLVSFILAALAFRVWQAEPTIMIALREPFSGTSEAIPVDVFSILAVLFICIRALAGDYSRREPFWDGVRVSSAALFVAALPDFAAVILKPGHFSLSGAAGSWIFLVLAIPAMRQGARTILAWLGLWQRRTALIGHGPEAETAYGALSTSMSLGFDIQWVVSIGEVVQLPASLAKLKTMVTANASDAGLLVQAAGCDQAILAMNDVEQSAYPELVQRLSEANVGTAMVPPLARLPLGNLTTNVLFGRNILLFQVRDNLKRWPQRVFKRVFDVVGALCALVVLSPLFLVLAILVKRQDGGPIGYSQIRIGREGVPFRCLKFRTMARNADALLASWQKENPELYEEYQKSYKLRDDPRVTRLGKWMRRTSLDELPQLINILRGEMSFVGPRPVVEKELIDYYGPSAQLYMRVRPGLTGLWQVSGRSNTGYEERIAFDEWYILNWSVWYDLIILAQTFVAIASGHGAF
jgi:Undecaprenyl-phosphate galactose phosphotransferase WbaP